MNKYTLLCLPTLVAWCHHVLHGNAGSKDPEFCNHDWYYISDNENFQANFLLDGEDFYAEISHKVLQMTGCTGRMDISLNFQNPRELLHVLFGNASKNSFVHVQYYNLGT